MASEIEKRKYPRASIRWPVSITTSNGSVRGVTEDISPEGFGSVGFIETMIRNRTV
ncbi:MAG: hypothetical protein GQ542_13865 [Desulforhopalus sp.]|nr:hypothetical protein [Desulforhopalus sp.]